MQRPYLGPCKTSMIEFYHTFLTAFTKKKIHDKPQMFYMVLNRPLCNICGNKQVYAWLQTKIYRKFGEILPWNALLEIWIRVIKEAYLGLFQISMMKSFCENSLRDLRSKTHPCFYGTILMILWKKSLVQSFVLF